MANRIIWTPNGPSREIRAKNLFGLETCRFTHLYGQTGEDNEKGDHLAIMPEIDKGIYAAIDLIRSNYLTAGFFVTFVLGNRWSGDLSKRYGKNLASFLGISPFLPIPFKTYGDRLLRGMAIMENGDPCRNLPLGFFGQLIEEDL